MGYGVSVEGERRTSEDCCASEEQAKETGVSCERAEVMGCSAAEWAANSGEEGGRATCEDGTQRVLTSGKRSMLEKSLVSLGCRILKEKMRLLYLRLGGGDGDLRRLGEGER